MFQAGDPAPLFVCRSSNSEEFHLEAAAGRYLVLCFFGSTTFPGVHQALDLLTNTLQNYFTLDLAFFGISIDPKDETDQRVKQKLPAILYFWDFDRKVSQLFQAVSKDGTNYYPHTLILDPMLRVVADIPLTTTEEHNEKVGDIIRNLMQSQTQKELTQHAPVLILPRIFEREFCQKLIDIYLHSESYDSGFMTEEGGYTIAKTDSEFKRRRDFNLQEDPKYKSVINEIKDKLYKRLVPEIKKAFQFNPLYIERYVIACYDSKTGGFFKSHRDNTTKGTAHRRFAVTINLNAEDYEGGELSFLEFGKQLYRAPTGGAVVFSCSLLHEATPVTRGVRYAFLPFLYDENAAKIREENLRYVAK